MSKLLLMSVIFATIALPAVAARQRDSKRALGRLLLWMLGFNVFYLLAVRFIYPRL